MRETAYAKINLALHVRERMADGYHRLETLFVFAEGGDDLDFAPAASLSLAVEGPFARQVPAGADNLVLQAARALRDRLGIAAGAAITLTKNLPVAAGIGGGSADAAAALRGLSRLWNARLAEEDLEAIARRLGADVAACLRAQSCFGSGRGDVLLPVDGSGFSGLPLLLVNPGVPLSTPEIFARWDGIDRGPLEFGDPPAPDPGWRNDLAAPAIGMTERIAPLLARLRDAPGVALANMSGSGATCFALFTDQAACRRAAERLAAAEADWWVWPSRLR